MEQIVLEGRRDEDRREQRRSPSRHGRRAAGPATFRDLAHQKKIKSDDLSERVSGSASRWRRRP